MKHNVVVSTVVLGFLAFSAGTASPAFAADDGRNISSVNGSVTADAGASYSTLSTVNGSVRVREGASADLAKTVNGHIVVESEAKLGTLSTVNGSLRVGSGATIAREASTVNGSIQLAPRVRVGGDVSTVSGQIELEGAEVNGQISTRNGDIELTDGARVRGGIHVKASRNSGWSWGRSDPVKVHVCSTCVVEGELRFDQPVELRVDNGGRIGEVVGDSVTRR